MIKAIFKIVTIYYPNTKLSIIEEILDVRNVRMDTIGF